MDQTSNRQANSGEVHLRLDSPLPAPAIRAELEKVLASRTFRAARGQRKFLAYAVEKAVAGHGHLIKEYAIGTEAFGRDESFDPRLDPIVRTEARKLRNRLTKYYETEGEADEVRIEFRKGSYVPLFRAGTDTLRDPDDAAKTSEVLTERTGEESITRADDAVPPPVATTSVSVAPPPVLAAGFHVPRWAVVVVVAVLLLAAAGSALLFRSRSALPADALASNDTSIAVLPLVNLGDHEEEFFSDGLTEELIDALRQVPGLEVVGRTSSFHFKAKTLDMREINRTLHSRTVLVGSVLKAENRLRVTVQLNLAASGYHLWSGSYDRDVADSRTIPAEIAGAVTNVLGVTLTRNEAENLNRTSASPNPGAHEAYLKGLYFWNRLTVDGLNTATGYFKQAIAEDPSFARAYSALADCYVMAPQVATTPPLDVLSEIKSAASKALELDPGLGEPHFDLAVGAEYEFDWPTAETEFKKGLALSPGNAVGHLWYAKYLAIVGRKDEVLAHRTIAARLDPVSPYAVQSVAGYLSVTGRYPEAIAQFRSALALDPNFGLAHQGMGVAYALEGMCGDAIQELQLANRWMGGPRRMALLGWAYGVCGHPAEARQILNGFLKQSRQGRFPALAIAQVYIGLRENDHAFEWLEKAIDQRDLDVTLQWDSPYEPLRSDIRFGRLLRRMKLA